MASDILIKCQGEDNEYVSVSRTNLPSDPYDVIYLLKVEYAPRSCWRDVAAAYFDAGLLASGITVLEQSMSDDVDTALKGTEAQDKCSRLDLLAALGGAYLMSADTHHGEPGKRNEELEKARAVFGRADKIDVDDPNIWVARGWGEFAVGKTGPAREWFDNAHNKAFVLGSLGLAALLLNRPRDKASSIKHDPVMLLVNALRSRICPPATWTALGHALYRDGRLQETRDVARRALTAVANGPPQEKLEALYLIALVEQAERNSNGVEAMVTALREAYVQCGGDQDARILAMVADTMYNGGDFKKAEEFAAQAVARAQESPMASIGGMYTGLQKNILVQALFQHGRALQHLGKLVEAMETFDKIKSIMDNAGDHIISVNPGFYFRFGMLKLGIGGKEDEDTAAQCLKKVMDNTTERSYPAMRAMGFLLGRKFLLNMRRGKPRSGETYRKALEHLKTGLSVDAGGQEDIPANLVYAALTEESNPELALKSYETVIKIAEEKNIELEVEVWVNMASILSRMGRHEEAKKLIEKKVNKDDECPTVWYNKGRLAEIRREEDDAVVNFEKISEGEPHFSEAQVRLAVIASNRGNTEQAEGLLKEAMKNSITRPVAAAHLANLYGARSDNKMAQDVLEQHRGDCDYLSLAFTKFIFKWLPPRSNDDRRWRFLCEHIGAPVLSVLKRSKHNAYASNAAGLFFTEVKEIDNARDAFTAAGTAKSKSMAARVNLGHTEVIKGKDMAKNAFDNIGRPNKAILAGAKTQYEKAERLYSSVLKSSEPHSSAEAFHDSIEITHYLACAQYEAFDNKNARMNFQKVLRHQPGSWQTWYNLAITLYESARYRQMHHSKELEEMLLAKEEFVHAQRAMKTASALGTPDKGRDPVVGTRPDPRAVGEWYHFIKQESKRHEVNIVNARNETEDRKKKEAEREQKIKEMERAQEEKRMKALRRKEEEHEKMQRAAEQAAARLLEYERIEELEREKKRRKEEDDIIASSPEPDGEGASAAASSSKKKRRKRKVKDEEDEDGEPATDKKRKTSD